MLCYLNKLLPAPTPQVRERTFIDKVVATVKAGGRVLIPIVAIGRAQVGGALSAAAGVGVWRGWVGWGMTVPWGGVVWGLGCVRLGACVCAWWWCQPD
jgi:hypothetical protein